MFSKFPKRQQLFLDEICSGAKAATFRSFNSLAKWLRHPVLHVFCWKTTSCIRNQAHSVLDRNAQLSRTALKHIISTQAFRGYWDKKKSQFAGFKSIYIVHCQYVCRYNTYRFHICLYGSSAWRNNLCTSLQNRDVQEIEGWGGKTEQEMWVTFL